MAKSPSSRTGMAAAVINGWPTYLTLYGKRTTGGNTQLGPEPLWRVPLAQCNPKIKDGTASFTVPTLQFDEDTEIVSVWVEGKKPSGDYERMFELPLDTGSFMNNSLRMTTGCQLTLKDVTIRVD